MTTPPTITHRTVYHVGDLDEPRTTPYISYEGDGLSVSKCPHDWARIMGGGGAVYELNYAEGGQFLDAAVENKPRSTVANWCLANNYVEEVTVHRVVWEQDDETHYMLFYDEEQAEAEAFERQGSVEHTGGLALAANGVDYWKQAFEQAPKNASPLVIRDLLPVWYAEANGYDGVWWDEAHDPANHSAPRGVVFQSSLEHWSYEVVENIA